MKQEMVPALRFSEFREAGSWEEALLGDLGNFIGGGTPSKTEPEYWQGHIPWISSSDISDESISNYTITRFITNEAIKNSATKLIPKGSILLVSRVGVGKLAVSEEPLCTSQDFTSLIPSKDNSMFLAYYLKANSRKLDNLCQGMAIKGFTKEDVSSLSFYIPQLKEQQKIADCLSSLDELIAAHTQKQQELQSYKKGLLQNLFPAEGETLPALRFPEFKDAGDWVEAPLENVARYENGKAHEQDITKSGDYVVVNSKFISTDGEVKKYTDEAFCLAKKGDILMVLSDVPNGRAIAKCFFVDENNRYTVNQRICKLSPKKAVGIMLFYSLNRNPYFLAFDDGVKQTNLRKDDVLNCPLLLPKDIEEQKKIAECLCSVDDLIHSQAKKIEGLKSHKKGLMQQLFPSVDEVGV